MHLHGFRQREAAFETGAVAEGVPRDASTVLSMMAHVKHYRPSPVSLAVEPLQAKNVGTHELPVYHGGGLLPASVHKGVRVLTPGIFAPKGQWGIQLLTVEEILLAKDFSDQSIQYFERHVLDGAFLRNLLPGKSLVAGARCFLDWNGGG